MTATVPELSGVPVDSRDGMRILWDVPITMDDGNVLRADVFLPAEDGAYPTLLSYGPYAKGLAFQEGYPTAWETMASQHPDVVEGSTNAYQNWEVVDPEKWTVHGYAIVRVDSRGCGRSPGIVDHFSRRETQDFHDCIEWAAAEPWSDGNVGLSGVSYFGMNQWLVAATQPPHLRAICVWEGASDFYRDASHHGGILSTFWQHWYDKQVKSVQYGLGERGPRHPVTGQLVCGDESLTDEELAANRVDFGAEVRAHPFIDDYHRDRTPEWDRITVPLLTAGNWGGQGLHLRGNVEGFLQAGSERKWLEMHGLEHWTTYYMDYGREIQLQFFDHVIKGLDNGWDQRPPVQLQVRHIDDTYEERWEEAWPLPATRWTDLHLDLGNGTLVPEPAAGSLAYDAMSAGVAFRTEPFAEEVELTGPVAAELRVSTTAADADLFLTLRAIDPDGNHRSFVGAVDPHIPATQGWLRLSHRELDPERSTPYRPVHTHVAAAEVEPGTPYDVQVELWPTSLVLPAGSRLELLVGGRDYADTSLPPITMSNFKNQMTGCGPFLHDDPEDRPEGTFAGTVTLHAGAEGGCLLRLPVVPR
ncbi:MAG TPA: CocE/NonD family hydrolase [Nocardioides sp.]|uniref:CocE/NonD family hydrolase n=1 Tax=Nocardioides sp. TaxID=35761 RepID=UPI002CA1AEBC|nr:CocE/NonD family hydrolase [Nocardioides sp.]HTW16655.1 CocE/NonD family hydrolase [Nocardioides sp.]